MGVLTRLHHHLLAVHELLVGLLLHHVAVHIYELPVHVHHHLLLLLHRRLLHNLLLLGIDVWLLLLVGSPIVILIGVCGRGWLRRGDLLARVGLLLLRGTICRWLGFLGLLLGLLLLRLLLLCGLLVAHI